MINQAKIEKLGRSLDQAGYPVSIKSPTKDKPIVLLAKTGQNFPASQVKMQRSIIDLLKVKVGDAVEIEACAVEKAKRIVVKPEYSDASGGHFFAF